jgi:hypothetical protein
MRRNKEAGQALVLVAAGLVVLIGVAGLGVDMGVLRYEKRIQQTAADAAAIASADNLAHPSNGGVVEAGQNASAANGFTDGGSGTLSTCTAAGAAVGTTCIQINNPPQSGPHASCTIPCGYVEAYVSEVHDTYFMKIFGVTKEVVTARAVATGLSGTNQDCFYLLGPHPNGIGINVTGGGNGKGGASINAGNCGVMDNGDFNSGNSSNWSMTTGSFSVAGSDTGGKGAVTCTSGQSSCPVYGVPTAGNPLASFPVPPEASQAEKTWSNNNPQPGHYASINIANSTVVLPSGNYVVDGGSLAYQGNANITGNGVMFYLENKATWSGVGTASITLTPPVAPSPYAGVLIYQNPAGCDASCDDRLAGGGNSIPDAGFSGLVVIWGLTLHGTDKLYLNGTSGYTVSLLKNAVLVE